MSGVFDYLTHLVKNFFPTANLRRQRWDGPAEVDEDVPAKRLKIDPSLPAKDSNIVSRFLKDSNTQTDESCIEMAKKDKGSCVILVDDDEDTAKNSQATNKENISSMRKSLLNIKPPSHCSRLNLKTPAPSWNSLDKSTDDVLFVSASNVDDNDIQFLGSVSAKTPQLLDENISRRPLWKRSVDLPLNSRLRRVNNISFKKVFPTLKMSTPSKILDVLTTKGYSEIVQQVVESPQFFSKITDLKPVIPKGTIIDLTSEIEKKKSHQTIDLTEGDEVTEVIDLVKTPRPKVTPVNSMEKKLRETKVASESAINDLEKELSQLRARYEESQTKLLTEFSAQSSLVSPWQKALEERVKRHLKITQSIVDLEKEEIEETVLPEIPEHLTKKVNYAWSSGSSNEVLVSRFNYQIKRCDLKTLYGLNWLNDEVINFYMELIMQRSKSCSALPKAHCFNTFFYSKLYKDGHAGLKRWTRKIDIFSFDVIFVPVHLTVHWCMAEINFVKREINYYDSMGHPNSKCLEALMEYLKDEMKDKKKECFDSTGWKKACIKDIPNQTNSSDCGVFACTFAEFLSRKAKFSFSQDDMPYMRRKMAAEILSAELLL